MKLRAILTIRERSGENEVCWSERGMRDVGSQMDRLTEIIFQSTVRQKTIDFSPTRQDRPKYAPIDLAYIMSKVFRFQPMINVLTENPRCRTPRACKSAIQAFQVFCHSPPQLEFSWIIARCSRHQVGSDHVLQNKSFIDRSGVPSA